MMKLAREKLQLILVEHKLWLDTARKLGTRADLCWANLSEAKLSGADLAGANLIGANFRGANLSEADLSKANLIGANLSKANLIRANLSRANFSGVNLSEADLSEADLRGANLSGVAIDGANLSEADFTGANIENLLGKDILTFSHNKHRAIYIDGYIHIGCKYDSIDYWVDNYEEIGKSEGYTKKEIDAYGEFIKYVFKVFHI